MPHGEEQISILRLGTSSIQAADERENGDTICYAVDMESIFFDMASAKAKHFAVYGRALVYSHYQKLEKKTSDCMECGHRNNRCPFRVDQIASMKTIAAYFDR